ncbi:hypothetical protein OIO07_11895 [Bacillus paralicheniformis]|nr:hypothetical protein [Bacillus paralicheniformis]MCV9368943.1 hypothetical protein [Bacillus paralicheniformis]
MRNPIIKSVFEKIEKQQEKGLEKYGTEVETDLYSLRGWLQHAQEEVIDLAVYLETAIQKIDEIEREKREMTLDMIINVTYKNGIKKEYMMIGDVNFDEEPSEEDKTGMAEEFLNALKQGKMYFAHPKGGTLINGHELIDAEIEFVINKKGE